LEINARAGLEIQNISDIRLNKVLNKIEDLHITDPQKGVEIAKTLFGQAKNNKESREKILYLSQMGTLTIYEQHTSSTENAEIRKTLSEPLSKQHDTLSYEIEIQVDLNKTKNYASPELYQQLQHTKHALHIELPENSILLHQLEFSPSEKLEHGIILGRNVAANFLIKPQTKQHTTINIIKPETIVESEVIALHQLDDAIDRLHKRLNLTAKLRPQNYLNELDNFIIRKGNYTPVFSYAFPDEKKMQQRKEELHQLKESCTNGTLRSPLVKLFDEKLNELFIRRDLLAAYKHQDFAKIDEGNKRLWGNFDEELIKLSKEKSNEREQRELLGRNLHFEQVKEIIEKKLNDLGIF
jgi:hypothetical protein